MLVRTGNLKARWDERATSRPILGLNFLLGNLDSRITYTGGANRTYFDSAGVLQDSSTNVARFDHDPSDNTPLGLSVWEQRINVGLQSEAMGTTWTIPGANTTITDNAGVAPDGATTAEDVEHGDNAETIKQTITSTDNTVYTISAFVKQGTTGSHDFVKIAWLDESGGNNGFEAWFNISTGAVGTAQANGTGSYTSGSAAITDVGSGWYRIQAAGQIVSGQTDARFEIINTTADAVDTAEATNSVFWWGLQAEVGLGASPYIRTTTGAVTATADVATMTGTNFSDWFNPNAGTFLVTGIPGAVGGIGNKYFFSVSNGNVSDRIGTYNSNDTRLSYIVTDGSSLQALFSGGDLVSGTEAKTASVYFVNDFNVMLGGASIGTDTTGTLPTVTQLNIGMSADGILEQFNGTIASIKYWNVRLPDLVLQDLTA